MYTRDRKIKCYRIFIFGWTHICQNKAPFSPSVFSVASWISLTACVTTAPNSSNTLLPKSKKDSNTSSSPTPSRKAESRALLAGLSTSSLSLSSWSSGLKALRRVWSNSWWKWETSTTLRLTRVPTLVSRLLKESSILTTSRSGFSALWFSTTSSWVSRGPKRELSLWKKFCSCGEQKNTMQLWYFDSIYSYQIVLKHSIWMAKVDEKSVLYWWRWRIHGGKCWYRSSYRCPQDMVDIPPKRTLETPYTAVRLRSASFLCPVWSLLPPDGARSQWKVSNIYIKMVLHFMFIFFCLTQLESLFILVLKNTT